MEADQANYLKLLEAEASSMRRKMTMCMALAVGGMLMGCIGIVVAACAMRRPEVPVDPFLRASKEQVEEIGARIEKQRSAMERMSSAIASATANANRADHFDLSNGEEALHLDAEGLWLSKGGKKLLTITATDNGGIVVLGDRAGVGSHTIFSMGSYLTYHDKILLAMGADKNGGAITFNELDETPRMIVGTANTVNSLGDKTQTSPGNITIFEKDGKVRWTTTTLYYRP